MERLHRSKVQPPETVPSVHEGCGGDPLPPPLRCDLDHPEIEVGVVEPITTWSGEALTTGKIPIRSDTADAPRLSRMERWRSCAARGGPTHRSRRPTIRRAASRASKGSATWME
ncbi:hypothetical protein [Microvirga tunisiensis]|uniref:hypothetical protein n=1 Tax=Microvirga tunisiensis TaxID=2108360 RepID=UPI001FCEBE3C|nr:hypothetical protein [Microvirga tunisiensis]